MIEGASIAKRNPASGRVVLYRTSPDGRYLLQTHYQPSDYKTI